MHIEKFTVRQRPYLRLVESKRRLSRNGKPISGKTLVLSLGPLSQHDDGKPDYLERLRKSFREGNPLIEALKPYVGDAPKEQWNVTFTAGDIRCFGEPKHLAHCVLDPIFSALGLDQFFASVKHSSKMQYDLQGIVRLLVYGRLLNPASKWATMLQNKDYLSPIAKKYKDDNVYDALTVIDKNAQKIFRRMNTCLMRGIGRNPSTVFYDVTNFFFETSKADEDELDEQGNILQKGLKKFGVSKENRKQPIVQVGLFMDDNGIPISFGMFPENMLDHNTLRPAMKESVDTFELGRFILVADRGMYNGTNMCHVTDGGNGTPEHINAHLMICFIALTMMRLIQRKISLSKPKDDNEDIKWSYGMSGERIAKALKDWQALCHPGELYQMLNSSNEDIRSILSALGMNLKPMIYNKGDILTLKATINPF